MLIINPTKKSLPFFSKMPVATGKAQTKADAQVNPLFSWHANYFTRNRKKNLLFVNDASGLAFVIADVNASKKGQLADIIRHGMSQMLKYAGVAQAQMDSYFEQGQEMVVNGAFNRKILGVMNIMQYSIDRFAMNNNVDLQVALSKHLSDEIYSINKYEKATTVVKHLFEEPVVFKGAILEAKAPKPTPGKLTKSWEDLADFEQFAGSEYGENQLAEKRLEKNNQLLVADFQQYLKDKEMAPKSIRKHGETVQIFLEFMLTRLYNTPISNYDFMAEFLDYWYPTKVATSATQVKSAGAGLKKFYEYLYLTEQIDKPTLASVKERIGDSVELGLESFDENNLYW